MKIELNDIWTIFLSHFKIDLSSWRSIYILTSPNCSFYPQETLIWILIIPNRAFPCIKIEYLAIFAHFSRISNLKINSYKQTIYPPTSNVGSVVEFSPATREARVRFPDVASFLSLIPASKEIEIDQILVHLHSGRKVWSTFLSVYCKMDNQKMNIPVLWRQKSEQRIFSEWTVF